MLMQLTLVLWGFDPWEQGLAQGLDIGRDVRRSRYQYPPINQQVGRGQHAQGPDALLLGHDLVVALGGVAESQQSLRREARLLPQRGEHPGIADVAALLEESLEQGIRDLTLPLVAPRQLHQAMRLARVREPLQA